MQYIFFLSLRIDTQESKMARPGQKWRATRSVSRVRMQNLAVPRSSKASLVSLVPLVGRTQCIPSSSPPRASPLPPANEHGGHSPTVCQSPSSYAFFMGQLGTVWLSTSSKYPTGVQSGWLFFFFSPFFGLLPPLSASRDTTHKIVLGFALAAVGGEFSGCSKEMYRIDLTIERRIYFP